jgi:alpha-galactosidase
MTNEWLGEVTEMILRPERVSQSPCCSVSSLAGAAIFVLILLMAAPVFSQVTNEAEAARLSNGAWVDTCATCSGGKNVKGIGDNYNGAVTFVTRVERGGLYPMTVLYNVSDDRAFNITVNINAHWDAIFLKTARRNESSRRTLLVPLNAGDNIIRFDNPGQAAPDLDAIIIGEASAESAGISGLVKNAGGAPLPGVEVALSGPFECKAVTDAQGRYEFPFLPTGDYYIRPFAPQIAFAPLEGFCSASNAGPYDCDFRAREMTAAASHVSTMKAGKWRIDYDLERGTADMFFDGQARIRNAFAVVRLPETVTSLDYPGRKVARQKIHDGFGRGIKYTVTSAKGSADEMIQTFWLYENTDYFLTDVQMHRKPAARSNFMSPLTTQTAVDFPPAGDDRALFVPFDNDKWIRYNAVPFGGEVASYEVSALYDNVSRHGLVIGSIEHDTWKTGVRSTTSSNAITGLEIFGGITSSRTRDVLPHGKISGETIKSPKVFVGCFADWRDGLEAYAGANAVAAPPRAWNGGVPFGWNSWGKLQFNVSFDKAVQVSDFFARELQPNHFENNGVVYIGLDSGWDRFSEVQLKQFVDHCRSNHQEAGIYFTPFALWHGNAGTPVAGTAYKYSDLYLTAHGRKESIAGGLAIDPTHPGTKKLIADTIARFKQAGFTYVKADFLAHGTLEADKYYDPKVTTGIQAYNEGMQFVDEQLGSGIYLNESIAPLFPSQYANSRRISCDAFGGIWETEYMLNSLTYGWWLGKIYDYNDADQMVLEGHGEGENRARVTSSAITGIFMTGDDFSDGGGGKERARKYLTNPRIDELARAHKNFRPVEGNTGDRAANLFTWDDGCEFYLAAFNFSGTNAHWDLTADRLGLKALHPVEGMELWTGAAQRMTNRISLDIGAGDAVLLRFP